LPWSRVEVEAIVADYIAMLKEELQQHPYSKTQHRTALAKHLDQRTHGSIERKHQNISAILIETGHPWIAGYKPLGNYQSLLAEVVEEWVATDKELARIVEYSIMAAASVPYVPEILTRAEAPPVFAEFKYPPLKEGVLVAGKTRTRANYLAMEASNSSLGLAGEKFILDFERERLHSLDRSQLADRIEHTSVSEGDGAGFDIRSFEADGSDRFIEVKTTSYGKQTPFFVSRNEVAVSEARQELYHLYRLFRFRADPRFYMIRGSIGERCFLNPLQYAARPKPS
jgi:hypothetical protein